MNLPETGAADDNDILKVLPNEEMKAGGKDDSDIWHLRKEHQDASKALRNRKISHDNYKGLNDNLSRPVEEITRMKTREEIPSRSRRPGLVHRKTDPCPMREFVRHNWNGEEINGGNLADVEEVKHETTPQRDEEVDITEDSKMNDDDEEVFLISSYELAKRRLSLPVAALSTLQQTWNNSCTMFDDSDETDNVDLETPVKNSHRPSCIKQLQHSPSMEQRRRQSAWVRARSLNDEANRPLSKRRMSELPALSALATRRRSAPHTLSIPLGLRRKTSRAGTSDHQSINSSCLKAKSKMLAHLSLPSCSENSTRKHHEICRRKTSCPTGFGHMTNKKEEKRLMVAHEILQTEKNYIKALETLNEVFTEPLKNSCVIPEKDIRTMFPKQLDAMKSGHEKFMKELDDRLNNWKCEGVLGDIFTRFGNSYHIDFMTLYSEYVNNFPKSIAVINKYTRNSQKFKRFLEKCGNDPRCERLSISAFLLSPIQRLPRYVLLLRQLAKYTDPKHPDTFHIDISLEKMIHIINILNSSIQSSTTVVRNSSLRRSSRRRRKRNIFKPKETPSSNLTSPRKSSDESECSEASTPSIPRAHDLSPLSIDTTSPDQKSSDYGSLTPSETPPEPRSPSPTSGSSSAKSTFLKAILRNGSESRRRKRRPLSTTEVEIRKNDCSQTLSKEAALKRSVSRDSIGNMIRNKFGTLRRRPRSSDENFDKNLSLERLSDSRSCKYLRPPSTEENSLNEINECSKSDSDFVEEKKYDEHNSSSSIESCAGSREHIPLSRKRSSLAREHSSLARAHSPLARQHSPLAREHSSLSCEQDHSDSDDSTTNHDSHFTNTLDSDITNNNNCGSKRTLGQQRRRLGDDTTDEQLSRRKKLGKRNSFTSAVKHLFVSKTRSASPETVLDCASMSNRQDQLYNSEFTKEKISAMTTV